jgi:hypothetical protein
MSFVVIIIAIAFVVEMSVALTKMRDEIRQVRWMDNLRA